MIRTLILPKADPISESSKPVEPVIINITSDSSTREKLESLGAVRIYYDDLAESLVDALIDSLPQGIIEPLIIKLMQKRVSLYCGTMKVM